MESGEILLRKGLLNTRQLEAARSRQADGTRLDQTAVEMGFVSEEAALRGHLGRLGSALEPWCGRWQSAWSRRFGWYVMIRATK
jgi:hypothetical protein